MEHKIISLVLAESQKAKKGETVELKSVQSAPQYYVSSIPHQSVIGQEKMKINGREMTFAVKSYPPDVLLVEAIATVNDVFSDAAFKLREDLIAGCHKIIKKHGGKADIAEEYSIAAVSGYSGEPEQFFAKAPLIASFLKSEKLTLDKKEIEYTLSAQIKYAQNDMVIIDWDGAFVFEPEGQINSIIELLEAANLQLLRYRVLDFDLDKRLQRALRLTQKPTAKTLIPLNRELAQSFREIIKIRAESIAEFDALEREIKLIGDWYSARLYDLISKKFHLDGWRNSIKNKQESLEDVYSIIAENFSVSRGKFLEFIQMILWFVLLAGWFVLLAFDIAASLK